MARSYSLLSSRTPTIAPAFVKIGHVQLRDLIICPREAGVVNYVYRNAIVEHDVRASGTPPNVIVDLNFTPNTIASLNLSGSDDTLLAAGGQDAEIHLSLAGPVAPASPGAPRTRMLWSFEATLPGSINNSVLLTTAQQSAAEPRLFVSNNNNTVCVYDVPLRTTGGAPKSINKCGMLRLDVPVNHSSISPDGWTLLSVGDSARVYLHRIGGGAHVSFDPITQLSVPQPAPLPHTSDTPALAASFSTAFSADGSKFAVAAQEGVVAVWDVRSTRPLRVFNTDRAPKRSGLGAGAGNGRGSGWLSDDPWEWTRHGSRAPGWGVRSVKFGSGGSDGSAGREVMAFTEHTSLLHVVDARTFETEEVIRVPSGSSSGHPPRPPTTRNRPPSPQRPAVYARHIAARYSSSPSPPPPPRPRILLALEETFRIPASPHRADDDDDDGVVVIPPMGDAGVEDEVRRLIGIDGLRARRASEDEHVLELFNAEPHEEAGGFSREDVGGLGHEDVNEEDYVHVGEMEGEGEEEMEVDELSSDCASTRYPSRAASAVPPKTHSAAELDLAGLCFDPSGARLYVASVDGVAEWAVRGAEKRWWSGGVWA